MTYWLSFLALALAWTAVTGNFTFANLIVGSAIAFVAMLFGRHGSAFPLKAWRFLVFIVAFLVELVLASLRVARDALSPRPGISPGVIALPLEARSDPEVTVVANLISLTPGTLSLDISDDRRYLYVHAMYVHDLDRVRASIKDGVERRTLELFR